MDIARIGTALRRRWYILVVGVLFAAVAAVITFSASSTSYVSTAKISLIPPNFSTEAIPQNPLLQLDSSIAQAASLLVDSLSSDAATSAINSSVGGTYTLSNVELRSEIFTGTISITATASSATGAKGTAQAVIDQISTQLDKLQTRAGVTQSATRILLDVTIPPTDSAPSSSGGTRAAAGAGVATIINFVLLALIIDLIINRRTRRRDIPAAPSTKAESTHGSENEATAPGQTKEASNFVGQEPLDRVPSTVWSRLSNWVSRRQHKMKS